MSESLSKSCTAFAGCRLLAAGPLIEVALAVKAASASGASASLLTFDDANGAVIDLDLRGAKADIIARLSAKSAAAPADSAASSSGDEDFGGDDSQAAPAVDAPVKADPNAPADPNSKDDLDLEL